MKSFRSIKPEDEKDLANFIKTTDSNGREVDSDSGIGSVDEEDIFVTAAQYERMRGTIAILEGKVDKAVKKKEEYKIKRDELAATVNDIIEAKQAMEDKFRQRKKKVKEAYMKLQEKNATLENQVKELTEKHNALLDRQSTSSSSSVSETCVWYNGKWTPQYLIPYQKVDSSIWDEVPPAHQSSQPLLN